MFEHQNLFSTWSKAYKAQNNGFVYVWKYTFSMYSVYRTHENHVSEHLYQRLGRRLYKYIISPVTRSFNLPELK